MSHCKTEIQYRTSNKLVDTVNKLIVWGVGTTRTLRVHWMLGHVGRRTRRGDEPCGVRSIVPGESWVWCYENSAFLGSRHLHGRG